jgi:hypothetical protein
MWKTRRPKLQAIRVRHCGNVEKVEKFGRNRDHVISPVSLSARLQRALRNGPGEPTYEKS